MGAQKYMVLTQHREVNCEDIIGNQLLANARTTVMEIRNTNYT